MLQHEPAVVRVLLAGVRGSAPREPGAGMLVSDGGIEGSIGGGQLEWQAMLAARSLLASAVPARVQRVVLGTERGQCCGGVVELWLERYTRAELALLNHVLRAAQRGPALLLSTMTLEGVERRVVCESGAMGAGAACDELLHARGAQALPRLLSVGPELTRLVERLDDPLPPLWLFGAGHVGQALARILSELPLRLTWIDSRAELLPEQIAASVELRHEPDPVGSVAAAPAGTRFLVLTHSHPLDYALCRRILERDDFTSLGLIGSGSKAARFRARLARDGLGAERIARLVCPIGVPGIASKWPAAIAVGVAAQLLRELSPVALHEPAAPRMQRGMQQGLQPGTQPGTVQCAPGCSYEQCASCAAAVPAIAAAAATD